ncbi:MAG: hypothetical protein QG639_874 [Patescibacteria group bacterium]|jgi:hypothetical protein|nr:hypothetical protein [Patescibacteria group bacterium]
MNSVATLFLFLLLIGNVVLFFVSKTQCARHNSFGITRKLSFLGMFVWGDVLMLAPFWIGVSILCLILQDWWLFLLIVSAFWLVRGIGETLYWFLQQFATVKRDPPESLAGYRFVKNESIWFMYQVMWQCLTVISLIATIYTAYMWLSVVTA